MTALGVCCAFGNGTETVCYRRIAAAVTCGSRLQIQRQFNNEHRRIEGVGGPEILVDASRAAPPSRNAGGKQVQRRCLAAAFSTHHWPCEPKGEEQCGEEAVSARRGCLGHQACPCPPSPLPGGPARGPSRRCGGDSDTDCQCGDTNADGDCGRTRGALEIHRHLFPGRSVWTDEPRLPHAMHATCGPVVFCV